MKRSSSLTILSFALLAGGCSTHISAMSPAAAEARPTERAEIDRAKGMLADRLTIDDAAGPVVLQKVAFRHGVSSVSVERLARRFGCAGGRGAGLITEKGPVEVYRMQCDNGASFVARCELRQCRPMR